jgi:hypothetical protein
MKLTDWVLIWGIVSCVTLAGGVTWVLDKLSSPKGQGGDR